MDLSVQPVPETVLLDFQVVANLEIQPEAFAHAKETRQAERRVRNDRPLTVNDFVDTTRRYADILGEPILAQTQRSQKLLEKDLSRVYRWNFLTHSVLILVGFCGVSGRDIS